jgi:FtsH-binding integral membrane protein
MFTDMGRPKAVSEIILYAGNMHVHCIDVAVVLSHDSVAHSLLITAATVQAVSLPAWSVEASLSKYTEVHYKDNS